MRGAELKKKLKSSSISRWPDAELRVITNEVLNPPPAAGRKPSGCPLLTRSAPHTLVCVCVMNEANFHKAVRVP